MSWLPTIVPLIAIILVTLQGFSFLSLGEPTPYRKLGGILNLVMAGGGLIALFLFRAGALIASPEYGALQMQGTAARLWACTLLVGAGLELGLIWEAARTRARRRFLRLPNRLPAILFAGACVGVIAATRVHSVNPSDPSPFCIRVYDLWWPPLLIWVVVCLSQWLSTTMIVRSGLARLLWAIYFTTGIAIVPVYRAIEGTHYGDASSPELWLITIYVGVPLLMLLSPLVLPLSKAKRRVIAAVSFSLGIFSVVLSVRNSRLAWLLQPWFLWVCWIIFFGVFTAIQLHKGQYRLVHLSDKMHGTSRSSDILALVAMAVIILSLADMLHFIWLDPSWDLACLIFAWMFLLEVLAGLAFKEFIPLAKGKVEGFVKKIAVSANQTAEKIGGFLRAFASVDSATGLLWRVIVIWTVILIFAEIPNSGKIIVHPFSAPGIDNQDIGKAVSDRIANTLSLVGQEIRPDLLIATPEGKGIWVMATSDETDVLRAAVKSNNVEIPGTKVTVPVEILTAPIQGPMRELLGVREIRGTIQKENADFTLLANSSTGQSWRITTGLEVRSESAKPVPAAQNTNPSFNSLTWTDELAYRVISSDNSLIKAGMTSSWKAIAPFREGLIQWDEFRLKEDYDALTKSIEKFQKAIDWDPKFALAYYRLGRALTEDGQPGAAVAAFRASLDADPSFVAGHIALADVLYNFDDYYSTAPAAVSVQRASSEESQCKNQRDAIEEWRLVIRDLGQKASTSDQAIAYASICRSLKKQIEEPDNACKRQSTSQYSTQDLRDAAFFYCKRAETLYSQLPAPRRSESQIIAARASTLTDLGEILEGREKIRSFQRKKESTASVNWSCALNEDATWKTAKPGPYMGSAMKYYKKAIALRPDDWRARCDLAMDSRILGDEGPMTDLELDDDAHLKLGDAFWRLGSQQSDVTQSASLYRRALEQYKAATTLAPSNTTALNDYGYAAWQWRLRSPNPPPLGPDELTLRRAENFVRSAVSLIQPSSSRKERAIIYSTLGEVLLAQARPHEAFQVLEHVKMGQHVFYDEVRWDLAQAYLCATANDAEAVTPDQETEDLRTKAVLLLNQIRDHESIREDRPYTRQPNAFNVNRPAAACLWKVGPDGPGYRLQSTNYTSNQPCNVLSLESDFTGEANDNGSNRDGLFLHFWGGGIDPVDYYIAIGKDEASVVLTASLRNTHQFYYVQLVNMPSSKKGDEVELPASRIYPVSTYASKTSGKCSKNKITLSWFGMRSNNEKRLVAKTEIQTRSPQ